MTRTMLGISSIGILGTLALGAAGIGGATSAVAQTGGQPDLGHYCRAYHGIQATVEFNAGRGEWVCAEQRGFARKLHRVDLADACKLTFGSGGFRQVGASAHCLGAVSKAMPRRLRQRSGAGLSGRSGAYRQVIPNLSAYCRKTYGRGTRVAFDRSSGLYACVQGRTRAYRRIDMAAACYQTVHTTNYRFDGDRREIRCLVSI